MSNLSNQQNFVYDLFNEGSDREIMFLKTDFNETDNRFIHYKGRNLHNFITNSYLALENDPRVKQAGIEGIEKYGVFTSVSRSYLSFNHYLELEEKLEKIYEKPVLVVNNTSQGHFAYLPLIIGQNDLVILDQFVHKTVQVAAQYMKGGGVQVEIVRHNRLDELEKKIKANENKFNKIWYLTDSVFSMHGNVAPLRELERLLNVYGKLNLYVDDAHGMSWIGKNGKGYCHHQVANHERMYVISSLNKGFGATNAAMVFPNQAAKDLVFKLGMPLIFSSPTMHAGITAASKIADIHLSEEIIERQVRLSERMKYFSKRVQELNLPAFNPGGNTPIGFFVLGNVEAMAQFVEKMQMKGFIMGAASYPSVPLKHSGARILITLHQTIEDIEKLVQCSAETIEELSLAGIYNYEENLKGFAKEKANLINA